MNDLQKAYLDGASMAYRDCADKLHEMIDACPEEIRGLMEVMRPLADACALKAEEVYREAERIEGNRQ